MPYFYIFESRFYPSFFKSLTENEQECRNISRATERGYLEKIAGLARTLCKGGYGSPSSMRI